MDEYRKLIKRFEPHTMVVGQRAAKPQLLVIDDDPSIRRGLKDFFKHSYTVISAADGQSGADLVTPAVCCIILDIKMEGLDGFKTFRKIKAKSPQTPIIFYTAFQSEHDLLEIINTYRPEGYIEKGRNPELLVSTTRNAVEKYQLHLAKETYRKRLKSKEAAFRSLLNASADAMILIDSDYKILETNRPARNIVGPQHPLRNGQSLLDFKDERYAERLQKAFQEAVRSKAPVHFQATLDERFFNTLISPVDDATEISQFAVTLRDMTHSRLTEQRFQMLIETMREGLFITDAGFRIIYVNDRFCELLDVSKEELLDHRLEERIITINGHAHEKKELLLNVSRNLEVEWQQGGTRRIYTLLAPRPIVDENQAFVGLFAVVTDISALKKVQKTLQKRESLLTAQKKELLETNNALNVILKKRQEDRFRLEDNIHSHVKTLVLPYLQRLKGSHLKVDQRSMVSILESNLQNIVGDFAHSLANRLYQLTPTELQIADLVKEGKTSKEIAVLLTMSSRTVETHRNNIREKLNLKKKRVNLRSFLLSLRDHPA